MPLVGDRDPDALAVLYDRHGAVAYSLAYRMVGERQAAEDVTQEAFISIWRNGGRFDPARGSARSWMLSIVRYRAIDMMRTRGAKAPKLDLDDSSAIELAYFGGFSHSQISKLLDLPLGTVKGRMRLGLEKIRREIAGDAA